MIEAQLFPVYTDLQLFPIYTRTKWPAICHEEGKELKDKRRGVKIFREKSRRNVPMTVEPQKNRR